jgi:hypothetical protein
VACWTGWLLSLNADAKLACSCDTTCTDDNQCTTDACYLGTCKSTKVNSGTACSIGGGPGTCTVSGTCVTKCGNGSCDSGETNATCPSDCKVSSGHPCDTICGNQNATYGCWCDAACKVNKDCCTASGGTGNSCSGSTCSICK